MKVFVLTFNGAAQNLASAISGMDLTKLGEGVDAPYRCLSLQPDKANAAACYLHNASDVTATNYGHQLPAATAGIAPAPYILGDFTAAGQFRLSDFWVIGANAEKLRVLAWPY